MKKQQAHEESGEKAPLWIISFADMISLLMAFFVMLQTMAAENTNDFLTVGKEKLRITVGEFRRNVNNFGIPRLFDKSVISSAPMQQSKINLENQEKEVEAPAKDGYEEKTRRLFTELSSLSETCISQLKGQQLTFDIASVAFNGEETDLNTEAKNYLTQFATTLQQTSQADKAVIYIVGLAADISTTQKQWTVSEQRAREVKSFLQSLLPEKESGSFLWWGAGSNMDGLNVHKTSSTLPYILIAIGTSDN